MPIFITQGRFTQDAVKGMLAKPEDHAESVATTAIIAAASGGVTDMKNAFAKAGSVAASFKAAGATQ